jgi:mRNA interferase MazF
MGGEHLHVAIHGEDRKVVGDRHGRDRAVGKTPRGDAGVVVTAQRLLDGSPSVVQVVPLTTTLRGFGSEVALEPDEVNRLKRRSAAQCQHVRAMSVERVDRVIGNVGVVGLAQIRETLGLLLDITA